MSYPLLLVGGGGAEMKDANDTTGIRKCLAGVEPDRQWAPAS